MDKRWILIIIILIAAISCGYLIISSSNTVGNAIVDVNSSTVTLPPGFSITGSEISNVELTKKPTSEKIFIKDLGKNSNAKLLFDKKLDSFSKNEDIEIFNNGTNSTDEFEYYTIYYQEYSKSDLDNQSVTYLNKSGHIYLLKFSGYTDMNQMDENLDTIIHTLNLDYKKSQE